MSLKIDIQGNKTFIDCNGKKTEHRTVFIKKMTVNDLLLYVNYKPLDKT